MIKKYKQDFLQGLKAQLDPAAASIAGYITEKTFINGKPFSFDGHEFQEFITQMIEDNPGWTFAIKKCSQIGLSELFNRIVLSRMALRPGEGVLVSFPSKSFSQEVIKTRFTEVIAESPSLKSLLDPNVDSASVKRFLNGSILYGLGGNKNSNSSLLNRPISLILVDEVDRQDVDVYSGFRSRMTHTAPENRLVLMISTPTAPGIGIDAEYDDCRIQYQAKLRCDCGHIWEPDYYKDIHIPGYNESLLLLTKSKAALLDTDKAYLECPECKSHLDQTNSKPVYIKKINEEGTAKRIGVALSPFCAPSFITPADLVESSLTYTSHVEFLNQGLGKTADLRDSSIPVDHIHFQADKPAGMRLVGLDMGKMCAFTSGILKPDTSIHIDTVENVKLAELDEFLTDFLKNNPTVAAVMDSAPYSDLVYKLVRKHPRLFSAIYSDPKPLPPELYKLKMHDKYGEVVRQVNITKNKMMDMFANSLEDFFTFSSTPNDHLILEHLTSMRRIRDYRYEEMVYKWVKPRNGEDHFFHSSVYLYTAGKLALADLSLGSFAIPVAVHKLNPNKKPK